MSQKIELTAIMVPKPGKAEEFIELFRNCAEYSEKYEPGTLLYELRRGIQDKNGGLEELVIREVYANQEAMDKHMSSPAVAKLAEVLKAGKLVESSKVIYTEPVVVVELSKL